MKLSTNITRILLLRTGLHSSPRNLQQHALLVGRAPPVKPALPTSVSPCCFSTTSSTRVDTNGSPTFSTSASIQYEDSEQESDILHVVTSTATAPDAGRLFAVVHLQGAQRKITVEDIVVLRSHLEANVGDIINLNKVMLVGGADFTIVGRPLLSRTMVKVEGCVIEKTLEHTKIAYDYTARRNNSRMYLCKKPLTVVRITNIQVSPLQQ